VIGAGIAGLTAARRLSDAQYQVVVLEARDRIGGRIHTVDDLGVPIDLGGSWIHGSRGNPLTRLAREIGARTVRTNYDSLSLYSSAGEVSDRDAARGERGWARIEGSIYDQQNDAGNDESVADGIANAGERRLAREPTTAWNMASSLEDDYAADPGELSLAWYGADKALPGPDLLMADGYLPLVRHVAGSVDVRLGNRVTLVEHAADGVAVHTDQGTLEADWGIVTLPLGVLQNEDVAFDPPLPKRKRTAINRLGMGLLDKVIVEFAEPFWPKDVQSFGFVGPSQPVTEAFNGLRFTGKPILVGFRGGRNARRREALSDAEDVAAVVSALSSAFGADVPQPSGALVTRWARDPFARGSYSYIAAGSTPADMRALGAPAGKRLLFAGEATNPDYFGTVHGAYWTGEREARRLQQLDA
jgi:polyamine oxidase